MEPKVLSAIMLALLLLSAVTLTFDVQSTVSETSGSGLVGYWKFDEGSGVTAFDSSGNGYDGTLVNGTLWVDGRYGKALSFDGIDDYVDCGTLGDFGSTVLRNVSTYTFWFKTSQTAYSCILGTANDYPTTVLVIHFNVPETDKIRFYLRDDNFKRLSGDLTETFDFTETGWHHFAVMVDTKNNDLTMYINGVSRSITYRYTESPTAFSDFQYPFFIGALDFEGSIDYGPPIQPLPMETFGGVLDEVRIYDRALSEEEIVAEFQGPVGGVYIPVNKLELLAPYIGLTILLAVAVMTIVYVKKRKRCLK